ncbi:IS630 family transposase [Spirosoma arboris]|uniref:IS630 family transposase n=1 Tax=Spirosoma arboris TaxID=2682092 RepID=UPI001D109A0F|nr:IS630 family transposase [Spirosoma arboris]
MASRTLTASAVRLNLKKAQAEQRVILYVDESACYLLPMLGLTWAPRGKTPVLMEKAGRDHLSLIAAIAPNGRIYVGGQDHSFSGEDIIWFLDKLCSRYRKRDLLIIWDGASIHSGEAVKAFLKERPGRVHLERLPAYSPELNPTELVWNQIKQGLKNRVFLSLDDLTVAVLEQVNLLEGNRKLVQVFFHKKEVAFFTD